MCSDSLRCLEFVLANLFKGFRDKNEWQSLFSPFRRDREASFKIDSTKNLGAGLGPHNNRLDAFKRCFLGVCFWYFITVEPRWYSFLQSTQ